MATTTPASNAAVPSRRTSRVSQYIALTKPRVVQLIVFCAVIGMLLAVPGLPDWHVALPATIGIWLVACYVCYAAGAVFQNVGFLTLHPLHTHRPCVYQGYGCATTKA